MPIGRPQEYANRHHAELPTHVILSEAKDLTRWAEMLRCAQHDSVVLSCRALGRRERSPEYQPHPIRSNRSAGHNTEERVEKEPGKIIEGLRECVISVRSKQLQNKTQQE